jgi:hypothetical protein
LQSQPDRLMLLRVLEYLVQIWRHQVKQYGQTHKSLASVKLQPVLPLVLHTGSYPWQKMGTLLDLMDDAEAFREVTPAFKPLFVSLPDVTEADLEEHGGYLGQVLALNRARKEKRGPFAQRLAQTVTKLQELTGPDRLRRLELLCYVEAFVKYSRESSEHKALYERIDAALYDDDARLEVEMVRRTMVDVHRDEGRAEGRREERIADRKRTLLEQLRLRWAPLPAETEQVLEATQDADQLAEWLRRFATATDLDAVGIVTPR